MSQTKIKPHHFCEHVFEKHLPINKSQLDHFWENLNLRETFIEKQVFPFRVEFESQKKSGTFYEGELNIHHGPLLSVHGAIGKVEKDYRDLKYFYGSYVLSFRLVRPRQLEFFKEEDGIRVKLTSFVRPWFVKYWEFGNGLMWSRFNVL